MVLVFQALHLEEWNEVVLVFKHYTLRNGMSCQNGEIVCKKVLYGHNLIWGGFPYLLFYSC